jgi:iron complex outermembrane receptor protein
MMKRSLLVGVSTIALLCFDWTNSARSQTVSAADHSDPATAQSDQNQVPKQVSQASGDAAERIIVTGTRQLNHTVEDSPAPIQVLGADDLAHSGAPNLKEVLNDVLPSLNIPVAGGGDITGVVRQISIRGLDPDHALVLINGKRRHVSALTSVAGTLGNGSQAADLNMFPLSAIDHIEVLTDGAAAQYGSDAIAGVVNIILKSTDHGGMVGASLGAYYEGDGLQMQADADSGFKFNVNGNTGFVHLSSSGIRQDATDRAGIATVSGANWYGPANPVLAAARPGPLNQKVFKTGNPENRNGSLAFNAGMPINTDISLYAFGTFAISSGKQQENYRAPGSDQNVRAIYPNGTQPREIVEQYDYALTGGAKGPSLLGWAWDFSTTWGRNLANIEVDNSMNPTFGNQTPTKFFNGAWISSEITTNLDFTKTITTNFMPAPLDLAFGFENRIDNYRISPGDVTSYADGGQPVLDGANAGKFLDAPGAQSFNGFLPSQASNHWRFSDSGYGEIDTKLLPNWQTGFAARIEKYSDFGTTIIGKMSNRYDITDAVAVRATFSNGFRAPSLGEEFYQTSTTNFTTIPGGARVPFNSVNLPVTAPAAGLLGAKPLQPETSGNMSVGFVLKPLPKMTASIDAYQIDISNRIVQSSPIGQVSPGQTATFAGTTYVAGQINPAVAQLLQANGILGVDTARYFLNGVSTRTRGIDITGDYRTDFGEYGSVKWTLGTNLNYTRILHLNPLATNVKFGTVLFPKLAQDGLSNSAPKSKIILGINYSIDRWTIMLRNTRYGKALAEAQAGNVIAYSPMTPKYITDLEVAYDVTDSIRVALGGTNIFNIYPNLVNPLANPAVSSFNNKTYTGATPFGFSGGFYYMRASYTW